MANNSLLIGKYIRKFLTENQEVNSLTHGNIGPLVANENTTFPFIVFSRSSLTPDYDKDGNYQDNIEVQIIAVSNDYTQVIDVANAVRKAIDRHTYSDDTIDITSMRLSTAQEEYVDDAYLQILTFSIMTN